MEIYVARQPVFTAQREIFGYELLFRQGFENSFPDIDGCTATSQVLSNTFFSFELNEILGNRPGLINFTRNLIVKRTPLLFPKEHIIIEVLENIAPDPEVLNALFELRTKGFRIALDDFVYDEKYNEMIRLCHMIKFDLMATPLDTLGPVLASKAISGNEIALLAEKVETYEAFEQAKAMGFELFQGYFFSKPEILSKKTIAPNQVSQFKLIGETNKSDVDLQVLEGLIKQDVAISFKLLKFINSAYFQRRTPIDTIKDAIMFMGTDELKKFINVAVISSLNPDKPNELIRSSVIRARMCEQCGSMLKTHFSTDELFTLGLFSAMDAIMDMPMKDILADIALSETIKDALLGKDTLFEQLSTLVTNYEQGRWDNQLFHRLEGGKLIHQLPAIYLDALQMANAFFSPAA